MPTAELGDMPPLVERTLSATGSLFQVPLNTVPLISTQNEPYSSSELEICISQTAFSNLWTKVYIERADHPILQNDLSSADRTKILETPCKES